MDVVTREIFAGVSPVGKVIFYLLAALSLGWAGVGCWRRVRLWRQGHPADLGPWGPRLRQWATFGLGQRRLPRRRFAGVIHRLTFSGFLVLGLGTLLLALDYATPLDFHHGTYYRVYELVLDLFGLAFVVGSGLIVYRRLFHIPPSLSTCPNEFRMLLLLAAIGVTGFLLEGLRILAEQTPLRVAAWSPIGYGVSRLLAGLFPPPTSGGLGVAAQVRSVVWWLHAGLALTLLALFPWRRTSHALASFVHLLVRPVRHPGALAPSGNWEIRKLGNWEIRQLGNPEIWQPENSDMASQFPLLRSPVAQLPNCPVSQFPSFPFSWPQLIALDACMACGRCNDACPATAAAEPLKPKELVQSLRKWMSHGHGASPFGELVTEEAVWACTLCQACAFECPPLCGPSDLIVALRRQWVAAGERGELPRNLQHAATNESGAAGRPNLFGAATAQPPTSWDVQPVALLSGEERSRFGGSLTLPAGVATVLRHLRETGNPWGCPAAERTRWAEGLDVPLLRDHPTAKVLYWVGCAAAYEERAQAVARAMVHLLRQAGVDFAILGAEETCTGDAARRLGDEALFQRLAAANVATLNNYRVRCIVTACPHCFNTLRHEYPVMGGKYEVIHHTALLSDLAGVGRLRVLGGSCTPDPGGRVTYHDPCHLGRINGVLGPPRTLLDTTGAERVEMVHHGADSACCGAGGGRFWLDGASPGPITHRRLAEAHATGATTLVTACPFCLLQIGRADTRGLVVRDVAEVVAGVIRDA